MKDTQDQDQSDGFWKSLKDVFSRRSSATLRDSVADALDDYRPHEDGPALGEGERRMLFNILEYGEVRVDDVMVPRADVIAVDEDLSFEDLLNVAAKSAHSRLPVFRESLDSIIGMIHMKDLVRAISKGVNGDFNVKALCRPVLFVPASMRIRDLMAKMRIRRTHMAIVVDEYGGTDGLVTIEDLVEQIVGDIEDEHDEDESLLLLISETGVIDADARVEVEELETRLGVDFLDDDEIEDVDTLGGLVFALAGRVPEIGEVIEHHSGYGLEVLDADPRRIRKIRLHPPGRAPGQGQGQGQDKDKDKGQGASQPDKTVGASIP